MRLGHSITGKEATRGSLLARVPPWLLAFLLTGCPLDPLTFTPGTGTTTTSSSTSTTTLSMSTSMSMTVGCSTLKDPSECDDGNPCTVDTCEDGVCSYEASPVGTACADANLCNGEETCDEKGFCAAGVPKEIDDGDDCTFDVCDSQTGEVKHSVSPACADWEEVPLTGAPTPRTNHTALWTGTDMIIWGGEVALSVDPAGVTATGALYNPVTKTWKAMSVAGAPPPRHSHQAVWTGSKMIVWGGFGDTAMEPNGGIYDVATDSWTDLPSAGTLQGRVQHRVIWTGTEMIVWGGLNMVALNTGSRYNLASNTWTTIPLGASGRFNHGVLWTGSKMIVWGGNDYFDWHQDGQFYDPAAGWGAQTSLTNVPDRREGHTSLWTGTQMIVWGGFDGGIRLNTGGVFDPAAADSAAWTTITTTGAPYGREKHVSVWTGAQLMVWGGCGVGAGGNDSCASPTAPFADGGFWTPGPNGGSWAPVLEGDVTAGRVNATAVWTGDRVIIWGGKAGLTGKLLDTGAQSVP